MGAGAEVGVEVDSEGVGAACFSLLRNAILTPAGRVDMDFADTVDGGRRPSAALKRRGPSLTFGLMLNWEKSNFSVSGARSVCEDSLRSAAESPLCACCAFSYRLMDTSEAA